ASRRAGYRAHRAESRGRRGVRVGAPRAPAPALRTAPRTARASRNSPDAKRKDAAARRPSSSRSRARLERATELGDAGTGAVDGPFGAEAMEVGALEHDGAAVLGEPPGIAAAHVVDRASGCDVRADAPDGPEERRQVWREEARRIPRRAEQGEAAPYDIVETPRRAPAAHTPPQAEAH